MTNLEPADGANFRRAMRQLPGGVTVVTATGREGPAGVTATAIASLAALPPSLLVVMDRWNWVRARAEGDGKFGVSLLGVGQQDVAERFSRGATASFDSLALVESPSAPPLLADAPTSLLCRYVETVEWYERAALLGIVESVHFGPDAAPLVYADGSYYGLERLQGESTPSPSS